MIRLWQQIDGVAQTLEHFDATETILSQCARQMFLASVENCIGPHERRTAELFVDFSAFCHEQGRLHEFFDNFLRFLPTYTSSADPKHSLLTSGLNTLLHRSSTVGLTPPELLACYFHDGHPFIGRAHLREALAYMADPTNKRKQVLSIFGKKNTGKSYSRKLLNHVLPRENDIVIPLTQEHVAEVNNLQELMHHIWQAISSNSTRPISRTRLSDILNASPEELLILFFDLLQMVPERIWLVLDEYTCYDWEINIRHFIHSIINNITDFAPLKLRVLFIDQKAILEREDLWDWDEACELRQDELNHFIRVWRYQNRKKALSVSNIRTLALSVWETAQTRINAIGVNPALNSAVGSWKKTFLED